jgi:hypothetical protein
MTTTTSGLTSTSPTTVTGAVDRRLRRGSAIMANHYWTASAPDSRARLSTIDDVCSVPLRGRIDSAAPGRQRLSRMRSGVEAFGKHGEGVVDDGDE